jgi:hypothetical protein
LRCWVEVGVPIMFKENTTCCFTFKNLELKVTNDWWSYEVNNVNCYRLLAYTFRISIRHKTDVAMLKVNDVIKWKITHL